MNRFKYSSSAVGIGPQDWHLVRGEKMWCAAAVTRGVRAVRRGRSEVTFDLRLPLPLREQEKRAVARGCKAIPDEGNGAAAPCWQSRRRPLRRGLHTPGAM